ncbi:MAG: radical SAM protein [Wujia sp.]
MKGVCGETHRLKVARAALHYWEEPCISGVEGSGAIFFSGCALHCVYCQNREIANGNVGKLIREERLAEIMLELQAKKANNINLVTPGHFVPQIVRAIEQARDNGLRLPILYNTSGYENVDTLKMLEGYVDIYLPDFKYMDEKLAGKFSHATDYPDVVKAAIAEMVRQTGKPIFKDNDEEGLMEKGTIVRHLALPGQQEDSKRIIKYLHETYGDMIYISIMNQFTPLDGLASYPEINRRLTEAEYEELVDYAIGIGVEQGFVQEGDTALESFIPLFDLEGV